MRRQPGPYRGVKKLRPQACATRLATKQSSAVATPCCLRGKTLGTQIFEGLANEHMGLTALSRCWHTWRRCPFLWVIEARSSNWHKPPCYSCRCAECTTIFPQPKVLKYRSQQLIWSHSSARLWPFAGGLGSLRNNTRNTPVCICRAAVDASTNRCRPLPYLFPQA